MRNSATTSYARFIVHIYKRRKKMKKLLTFITLTLALICLLASCGGQKDEHTHDFGEWKVTKAPTCTEEGAEVRYCDCGEKQTEVVVALGHTFADWVTVKEPTVTEEGLKESTCACGGC